MDRSDSHERQRQDPKVPDEVGCDASRISSRAKARANHSAVEVNWTIDQVLWANENLPAVPHDDDLWRKIWTRPSIEFGLRIDETPPVVPFEEWPDEWDPFAKMIVPLNRITTTRQNEGVRLDTLAWYVNVDDPSELFDPEGWYNNDEPVLIQRRHGVYTVADGNHRVITAMLRKNTFISAYVQKGY